MPKKPVKKFRLGKSKAMTYEELDRIRDATTKRISKKSKREIGDMSRKALERLRKQNKYSLMRKDFYYRIQYNLAAISGARTNLYTEMRKFYLGRMNPELRTAMEGENLQESKKRVESLANKKGINVAKKIVKQGRILVGRWLKKLLELDKEKLIYYCRGKDESNDPLIMDVARNAMSGIISKIGVLDKLIDRLEKE